MNRGKKIEHDKGNEPLHTDFVNLGYTVTYVEPTDPEHSKNQQQPKTRMSRNQFQDEQAKQANVEFT